jgi:type I restriction enzyme R subunit
LASTSTPTADGRGERRCHAADPLRRQDSRQRAEAKSTPSIQRSRTCSGPQSEEELLAIKKKYGATGDILEAEKRINAIARDLVAHYVDNILPNGFKAQVVCHSKLAASAIRRRASKPLWPSVWPRRRLKPTPDAELIKRLRFLKTAVVVSSRTAPTSRLTSRMRARKRSA